MTKSKISQRVLGTGAAVALSAGIGLATAPEAQADVWDRVAACESGNNWGISTGNGYYGGLQFSQSTWRANGGSGNPANASKAEQKRVARNTLKTQGPGAWPVCSKKAGLTRSNGGSASSADSSSSSRSSSYSKKSYQSNQQSSTSQQSSSSQQKSYTPRRSSGSYSSEKSYSPRRAVRVDTVTVKAGDTLAKIAARQGTTWRSLYQLNSGKIANPNLIYVGQVLTVG